MQISFLFQVPELNHTRAVHSPAITPPEHAASMDAKLLAAAVSSSTNGTTHTTSQQTAAVNAFHQTLAAAAASGQINGGNTPSAVSAALALNQVGFYANFMIFKNFENFKNFLSIHRFFKFSCHTQTRSDVHLQIFKN